MENLIGFGIMGMPVLNKRLAAVCKSDTIHCSPLQYPEFQQKPPHVPLTGSHIYTNIQYRSLSFLTLSGKQCIFWISDVVSSSYAQNVDECMK